MNTNTYECIHVLCLSVVGEAVYIVWTIWVLKLLRFRELRDYVLEGVENFNEIVKSWNKLEQKY
jgi:hypothetical protein